MSSDSGPESARGTRGYFVDYSSYSRVDARHSRPGDVVLSPRARPRQGARARRRSLLVLLPAALYILLLRLRGSERGGAEVLFLHRALSATDEAHDDDGERREPSLDPRGVDGVGAGDGFRDTTNASMSRTVAAAEAPRRGVPACSSIAAVGPRVARRNVSAAAARSSYACEWRWRLLTRSLSRWRRRRRPPGAHAEDVATKAVARVHAIERPADGETRERGQFRDGDVGDCGGRDVRTRRPRRDHRRGHRRGAGGWRARARGPDVAREGRVGVEDASVRGEGARDGVGVPSESSSAGTASSVGASRATA